MNGMEVMSAEWKGNEFEKLLPWQEEERKEEVHFMMNLWS